MADEKAPPVISARALAMGHLYEQLEKHPKLGPLAQALVAEAFPNESAGEFPGIEARKAVAPYVKKLEDERAAIAKERADEKAAKTTAEWYASLTQAGIPESAHVEITKIANERGNIDPVALKLYYDSTQKPAQPTTRGYGVSIPGRNKAGGEWFDSDGQGGPGIMQDRQTWTLNRASQVYEENAAGRR